MIDMKDTRKLSLIYFVISMVMLLMVVFGCERAIDVDYVHTANGYNVYYAETDNPEYVEIYAAHLKESVDNFIIQSDFGIIEVENGEVVYNNLLK